MKSTGRWSGKERHLQVVPEDGKVPKPKPDYEYPDYEYPGMTESHKIGISIITVLLILWVVIFVGCLTVWALR